VNGGVWGGRFHVWFDQCKQGESVYVYFRYGLDGIFDFVHPLEKYDICAWEYQHLKEVGSHVVYWKQLCVRYICLDGGHMMKENSYNYGRDKKDTRLFVNI